MVNVRALLGPLGVVMMTLCGPSTAVAPMVKRPWLRYRRR